MLSCRASTQAVVYDDYSAECGTPKYAAFQLLAILIIALFAFGVPLGLRATPPYSHRIYLYLVPRTSNA